MIDLRLLRQDPEGTRAALLRRGDPALADALDRVLEHDQRWRRLVVEVERLKAERNAQSEEVARKKRGRLPADVLLAALKASSERVKSLDVETREAEDTLNQALLRIPNLPHPGLPEGPPEANRIVRTWGEK